VHHHAQLGCSFPENGKGVLIGRSCVDDYRQPEAGRQVDLSTECVPLILAGGIVSVIVKAALTDRDNLAIGGGMLDRTDICVTKAFCGVGVPADNRAHLGVGTSEPNRVLDRLWVGADGGDPAYPDLTRALDQVAVGQRAGIHMAVGIDHDG
jgi:hypothetical protein